MTAVTIGPKGDTRIFPGSEVFPMSVADQRAYLPCGCSVWIGIRTDNHEAVTIAEPCGPAHTPLVARFNDLFRWSLEGGGTDELLINVVADVLERAEQG